MSKTVEEKISELRVIAFIIVIGLGLVCLIMAFAIRDLRDSVCEITHEEKYGNQCDVEKP